MYLTIILEVQHVQLRLHNDDTEEVWRANMRM